jgi:peptidyl-prolyl cis-trans isomerase SurA
MGWIRQGELEPEVENTLAKMQPGRIAGPIRTIGGYHILYLRQRRIAEGIATPDVSLNLQQLFFPLAQGVGPTETSEAFDTARATATKADSCAAMETLARDLGTPMSGSLGTVQLDQLPDPLRNAVKDLALNTPSEPVRTDQGVVVLMVCERDGDAGQEAARKKVEQMLFSERLDAAARRYLRDMRRAAFIDVRI